LRVESFWVVALAPQNYPKIIFKIIFNQIFNPFQA